MCYTYFKIVRRIREKYSIELKEAEKSERTTIEKFNELKVNVSLTRFIKLQVLYLLCHIDMIIPSRYIL